MATQRKSLAHDGVMYRNGEIHTVSAIVAEDKHFNNGGFLPFKETYPNNAKGKDIVGISVQVETMDIVTVEGVDLPLKGYYKVDFRKEHGVYDFGSKLKSGDRIRFTGQFKVTYGNKKVFKSFTVLHPDLVKKVDAPSEI